jgi:hypothetical protein
LCGVVRFTLALHIRLKLLLVDDATKVVRLHKVIGVLLQGGDLVSLSLWLLLAEAVVIIQL